MILFIISSFCSCEESEQKQFANDVFPNTKQLWGMVGTILATLTCWILYVKLKIRRKRLLQVQNARQTICTPRPVTKRREHH